MAQKQLLLQRYEVVKVLKNTEKIKMIVMVNRNNGERAIAKIQSTQIMKDSKSRNVLHQASFLQPMQGYRGIPFMIWSGKTKDNRIVLLVQQLGDTLSSRFSMCKYRFSPKTVCMLGIQMLEIIKVIHDKGYLHTQLSTDVFQFGKGSKCFNLYINTFIQCMVYRDPRTMKHILSAHQYFRSPQNIFQSSAVYSNKQKSRKDDIESIFLILIYFIKGELPWSKSFKKQSQYRTADPQFLSKFNDTKLICAGVPKIFYDVLQDCRNLKFQQQPPYHWYILKLKSYLYINGEQHDFIYDWMLSKQYSHKLKIPRKIPSIYFDKDKDFFSFLQENVFPDVEVDQIHIKHEYFIKQEQDKQKFQSSAQVSFDPYRERPNRQADAKIIGILEREQEERKKQKFDDKQQNLIEHDEQKKKDGKKNKNKSNSNIQNSNQINNNILDRKRKQKQQCVVM